MSGSFRNNEDEEWWNNVYEVDPVTNVNFVLAQISEVRLDDLFVNPRDKTLTESYSVKELGQAQNCLVHRTPQRYFIMFL